MYNTPEYNNPTDISDVFLVIKILFFENVLERNISNIEKILSSKIVVLKKLSYGSISVF